MKTLFTLAVAVLAAAACKRTPVPAAPPAGQTTVSLHVSAPGTFVRAGLTRALTAAQESELKSVHVLVFEGTSNADLAWNKSLTRVLGAQTLEEGEAEFQIATTPTEEDTYKKLVVLANASSVLETAGIVAGTLGTGRTAPADGASYTAVRDAIWQSAAEKIDSSDGLLMWGETGLETFGAGNNDAEVSLLRSLARIDVGVGAHTASADGTYTWDGKHDSKDVPFKLAKVVLMRPADRLQVMPDATKIELKDEKPTATGPSLSANTELISEDDSAGDFEYGGVTTVGEATWLTREIYTPESNVKVTSDGASGDANHLARTAIVVGGYYNGSDAVTYYRVDFIQDSKLVDLLRNHVYLLDIVAVTAPGFSTAKEAYERANSAITVDIVAWNVGTGEAFIIGDGFMSFQTRDLRWQDGSSTAPQSIELRSNISGVTISVGHTQTTVAASDTSKSWSGELFDYAWTIAENATGRLTVTPKSAYINNSGTVMAPRSETVTFTVNARTITFTATQVAATIATALPSLPGAGAWNPGGDVQIEN